MSDEELYVMIVSNMGSFYRRPSLSYKSYNNITLFRKVSLWEIKRVLHADVGRVKKFEIFRTETIVS